MHGCELSDGGIWKISDGKPPKTQNESHNASCFAPGQIDIEVKACASMRFVTTASKRICIPSQIPALKPCSHALNLSLVTGLNETWKSRRREGVNILQCSVKPDPRALC